MARKKSLIKRLVSELDEIVKQLVFERDVQEFGSKCCLCGGDGLALQWCHLISASKYSVRWHPLNSYRQCRGCNLRHEYHPQYYTAWWIARHGEKAYQALVDASNVQAKFKSKDLQAMIEGLKNLNGPENDI